MFTQPAMAGRFVYRSAATAKKLITNVIAVAVDASTTVVSV
jgi:hypothetical protein